MIIQLLSAKQPHDLMTVPVNDCAGMWAFGGGSKPLHDLISSLQASKDAKKDPAQVKTLEARGPLAAGPARAGLSRRG
jgi:hypothetical protein